MSNMWGLAAKGICEYNGKILLLKIRSKSSHDAGLWEIPGGKVKRGEFFDAALKREYKELYESRERLKVLNTELQKKNYEISYNNIDLLEQIKRYKRRNRNSTQRRRMEARLHRPPPQNCQSRCF